MPFTPENTNLAPKNKITPKVCESLLTEKEKIAIFVTEDEIQSAFSRIIILVATGLQGACI